MTPTLHKHLFGDTINEVAKQIVKKQRDDLLEVLHRISDKSKWHAIDESGDRLDWLHVEELAKAAIVKVEECNLARIAFAKTTGTDS